MKITLKPPWLKKLALIIFGLFALIGLLATLFISIVMLADYYERNKTYPLLLNTEIINQVPINQSVDIPATKLLPEKVKYVCSRAPYFSLSRTNIDEASFKMLNQVDSLIKDNEGIGYFIYFGQDKILIQYDKLFIYESKYRWSGTESGLSESDQEATRAIGDYCLESKNLSFKVTSQEDFYKILLKLSDKKQI